MNNFGPQSFEGGAEGEINNRLAQLLEKIAANTAKMSPEDLEKAKAIADSAETLVGKIQEENG